jgi:hypothetical protein
MDTAARAGALVLASFVAYYCVRGTPEEIMRAVKAVYYVLNLVGLYYGTPT